MIQNSIQMDTAPIIGVVVETRDLSKIYGGAEARVVALDNVSVTIRTGEYVAVMGTSGSGKSTFMNVLGCLDRPSLGSYELSGVDVSTLDDRALSLLRGRFIGFVFQGYNLLRRTTALENVEIPLIYQGVDAAERRERAVAALELVGLGNRLHHVPNQLSGGQQQRVAIARALVHRPKLILADEPTGNLDTRTTLEVLDIFDGLNARGMTIVLVTHEPDVGARANRVLQFRDGGVIADGSFSDVFGAPATLAVAP